jgi:hypothetical protein
MQFPSDFQAKKEKLLLQLFEFDEAFQDYKKQEAIQTKAMSVAMASNLGVWGLLVIFMIVYYSIFQQSILFYGFLAGLGFSLITLAVLIRIYLRYPSFDFRAKFKKSVTRAFFKVFYPSIVYQPFTARPSIQLLENWSILKDHHLLSFESLEDQIIIKAKHARYTFFEASIIQEANTERSRDVFKGLFMIISPKGRSNFSFNRIEDFKTKLKAFAAFWEAPARAEILESGKTLISIPSDKDFLEIDESYRTLYGSSLVENLYSEVQHILDFTNFIDQSISEQ